MSAQFGKCNFDGKPVDPKELDQVRPILAPYGPDGERCFCKDNFGVLYRAFHTTKESRREVQPHVSASGAVITWDGRLDNREELIDQLGRTLPQVSTDVGIVAAAYERWGITSFAKLIGDWALSIWSPTKQSLLLAKDFVGTRHLYYSVEKGQVTWCTIPDPLVLFAGHSFELEGEYLAGWLSFFPAPHLTPYVGIHSASPSCFIRLTNGTRTTTKYWDFDQARKIRYGSDQEYEEQFREVFAESVRRRLRSDSTVLAELSGGMDSSSIVCMADVVASRAPGEILRPDTVSYYDETEPNWNERPYFMRVEAQRGQTGCHIDASSKNQFEFESEEEFFAATPASTRHPNAIAKQVGEYLSSRHSRVVLSGVGGDEVTGGVPTAIPQLADLLARGRVTALSHYLKCWAIQERRPWFHLLCEVVRSFLSPSVVGIPKRRRPAPWLDDDFANRYRTALRGYEGSVKLFGPLPSFQENLITLEGLRRQLECTALWPQSLRETRYPYLDRNFLEFMFAIPRQQVIRPGQRRSLMRRALVGIVPDEILDRRRKAFVARAPIIALEKSDWVKTMIHNMATSSVGVVRSEKFCEVLHKACCGQDVSIVPLVRTVTLELWLRNARRKGLVAGSSALRKPNLSAAREGE